MIPPQCNDVFPLFRSDAAAAAASLAAATLPGGCSATGRFFLRLLPCDLAAASAATAAIDFCPDYGRRGKCSSCSRGEPIDATDECRAAAESTAGTQSAAAENVDGDVE